MMLGRSAELLAGQLISSNLGTTMARDTLVPQRSSVSLLSGLLFFTLLSGGAKAGSGDISGGWIVGDRGFASQSRIAAGSVVSIRVLAMGNARGIAVTFSGNQNAHTPGKLWDGAELREGSSINYRVPESLNGAQLAVRSGAAIGEFDQPLNSQVSEFAYQLSFASGRRLLVTVSTGRPQPGAVGDDLSGGWLVGDVGFASQSQVAEGSIVSIGVVNMGNSRGIVVTFSGNTRIDTPGIRWNRNELFEGQVVQYRVSRELNNARLAIRSGAAASGFDRPIRVQFEIDAYRLTFAGGRVLQVNVTRPRPRQLD